MTSTKKHRPPDAGTAPEVRTPKRPTPREGIPLRVMQPTLDDHLEIMTRAIFQGGLSWAFIAARWPVMRNAFDDFAISRVAEYGEGDVDRLMHVDGVIHSRAKIEAVIRNARALRSLAAEFGTVDAYAARFTDYDALFADARTRFAYVGDLNCYYWLFRTGQRVPPFEEWIRRQDRDHPRMREMVLAGRAAGTSTESAS
ncbi:MAG: DNA-3-methyladenine glycosylase I [Candidatus Velthaea sp.]